MTCHSHSRGLTLRCRGRCAIKPRWPLTSTFLNVRFPKAAISALGTEETVAHLVLASVLVNSNRNWWSA